MSYALALIALADPTRRAVFEKLREGPRSVGDMAEGMAVSRPAVSQHLKVLKDAALVTVHRRGTRQFYAIDTKGLSELQTYLEGFWSGALGAFKAYAEETQQKAQPRKRKASK